MAILIHADGSQETIAPDAGAHYQLAQLQALVGGQIEVLRTRGGQLLIVNEEGKLHRLPFNRKATALVAERRADSELDESIVGPALLLEPGEMA